MLADLTRAEPPGLERLACDAVDDAGTQRGGGVPSKVAELGGLPKLSQAGGTIAILSSASDAEQQNRWIRVMKARALEAGVRHLEPVIANGGDDDRVVCGDSASGAGAPDLTGIIALSTAATSAAARYLQRSVPKGQIAPIGLAR